MRRSSPSPWPAPAAAATSEVFFQGSWVPPHELASRALHSTRLKAVVEEQQRARAFSWRDARRARSAVSGGGVPANSEKCGAPRALNKACAGYTFLELLIVSAIIAILASAVMPLAKVTLQRQREITLRRDLREMRTAIDNFKDAVVQGRIATINLKPDSEGYPKDLETLVEGVPAANDATGHKLKFLRRVPVDPLTGSTEWQLRSYQDDQDSSRWGGQNVFDVRTKSEARALDGTYYKDW